MSAIRPAVTALLLVLLLALPACDFVGPTAPEDASISISANPLFIGLGGERSMITVLVSEGDGTPVPDETRVNLTTTLGTVPGEITLNGGVGQAELISGSQPGVATVTARSGVVGTSAAIDVIVGAILDSLAASATPAVLPDGGGASTIRVIAFGDDGEPLAGVPVTFSTTAGTLASAGSVRRTNAQGAVTDTLNTTQDATVTATSGAVTAEVTVSLAEGNVSPTASFAASPSNPAINQDVFFNASASEDSDGTIVSYEWDFGDGHTGTGVQTSHAYEVIRTFVVVLTVTDDDGATGVATVQVPVGLGTAPFAGFTFTPSQPSAGRVVTFDGSSSGDPDGTIVQYRWQWGDGTSPTVSAGPTAQHVFAAPGSYTVILTVRDDQGNTAVISQTVTVSP